MGLPSPMRSVEADPVWGVELSLNTRSVSLSSYPHPTLRSLTRTHIDTLAPPTLPSQRQLASQPPVPGADRHPITSSLQLRATCLTTRPKKEWKGEKNPSCPTPPPISAQPTFVLNGAVSSSMVGWPPHPHQLAHDKY